MKPNGHWLIIALGNTARALGTVITWCVIGAFVAVTAVSILWKLDTPPIGALNAAAAKLPSVFYADMISMEVTGLTEEEDSHSFSARNVTSFLTRVTTGIDPEDPRTLAAQLLPGAQDNMGIFLVRGIDTGPADYPVEVPPAPHLQEPAVIPLPEGYPDGGHVGEPPEPGSETDPALPGPDGQEPATPADPQPDKTRETGNNVVFVYHSHPSESYLPELEGVTDLDLAYNMKEKDKTVAAVGDRLTDSLNRLGIGSLHSSKPYAWRGAYNESRKTVKAAMQQHETLEYFIDIHRDAARKDKTLLKHEGKTYAKLFFVIGQKNPDYEKNQALANELHYRMEAKIKGISRGVVGKNVGSNGEFNQTLSPNSILVEFGGVDNTLEECYRTADLLAEVLAELYWERAEAVKASAEPTPAADTNSAE